MPMLVLLVLTGCLVPKKQLDAAHAELNDTRARLTAQLAERDSRVATLEEGLADAERRLTSLDAQHGALSAELARQKAAWDAERGDLVSDKAALLKDRTQLKATLEETETALKDLALRRMAAEARVAQYRDLLGRFKSLIDAGRLKVKIVEGRMVVELATDILFDSGKADLSETGKKALLEVAGVLATIPERHFQVEGHTDNVPIANDRFPSNWELASARSLVVVRTLIEGGLMPERVSGASFSEFHPVADNAAAPGRAANRRIEIVVVPDLSLLPGSEELKQAAGE